MPSMPVQWRVALKGKVDAIILTGGVSYGKAFTEIMTEYIDWIAEVVIMPGEFELEALAAGALRVMLGEEEAKAYTGIPCLERILNDYYNH